MPIGNAVALYPWISIDVASIGPLYGARLGVATESEYEAFADAIFGPPESSTRQFIRPWNGDLVRYDEAREVFGIVDRDGFIKTCYRPDPLIHGEATNLDYFLGEEAKA